MPCSSWLSQVRAASSAGVSAVRAALAAQPGLRWEVYTRFAVFVSSGALAPSASLVLLLRSGMTRQ